MEQKIGPPVQRRRSPDFSAPNFGSFAGSLGGGAIPAVSAPLSQSMWPAAASADALWAKEMTWAPGPLGMALQYAMRQLDAALAMLGQCVCRASRGAPLPAPALRRTTRVGVDFEV